MPGNNMRFTLEIPTAEISRMGQNILEEYRQHISKAMLQSQPFILKGIQLAISESLTNSPVWKSLIDGELQELFKIDYISNTLSDIEREIVQNIKITNDSIITGIQSLSGGFSIEILPDGSLTKIANFPSGSYRTANGRIISWLDALLFSGTRSLFIKARLIRSRNGVVLVPGNTDLAVPSAYAGTSDDNFLSRAIIPLEPTISRLIEDEISRRI